MPARKTETIKPVKPSKPRKAGRPSNHPGVKRPTTTIKVSRRVMRHIEGSSKTEESVDETLKRLLKLVIEDPNKPVLQPTLTTTIKVSRMVMNYIQKEAKKEESRDHTLARLLGIEQDDGNVQVRAK